MRRFLDGLYLGAGVLGAICLLAICVIMLLQVVMREMGMNLRGADDLTSWACAAVTILAIAHTFKRGELIRVGMLIEKFSGRPRRAIELAALGVTAAFAAYFTWWMAFFVYESWEFNETAPGLLPIPLWIPQVPLVFGAAVFVVAVLDELWTVIQGGTPAYELAAQERRARGDFSGEV